MHRFHEVLELLYLIAGAPARVLVVRREVRDRVVAPVVPQPSTLERRILDELLDWKKLDGCHAEALEVLHCGRMRHPRVLPAQIVRNIRVPDRESLDVGLVHHGPVPGNIWPAALRPVEERIDHDALRHVRRAVGIVARRLGLTELVREDRFVPLPQPFHGLCVRVQQEFVRIAPQAVGRIPGTVHAKAVTLARPDVGKIPMPAQRCRLGQSHARLASITVEQTKLDPFGDLGEEREIGAKSVIGSAQRIGPSRPDAHVQLIQSGVDRGFRNERRATPQTD